MDLNGQSIAQQWVETQVEIKRAEDEQRRASDRVRLLRDKLGRLSTELASKVGTNMPVKAWHCADRQIVIVEYGREIRLVEVEHKQL